MVKKGCSATSSKFASNGDCGGIVGLVGANSTLLCSSFIGTKIPDGSVKNNIGLASSDFYMVDPNNNDNGGAKAYGSIAGKVDAGAMVKGVSIIYSYFYMEGASNGSPRMGYFVGENYGYVGGYMTGSYYGEYHSVVPGKDYYFSSSTGGLVGKNGGTINFKSPVL